MMISVIQVILTGIILGHDCIADQIQDQSCIGNTELFKKMLTSNKACQAGDIEMAEFGHEKVKAGKQIVN